ncbi:MAG: serine/threonine protein kinase [Desulfobacterales bacterium]|jgi:Ser/Thr protein kinase RdoA (MazF antagonist)|nr:serine/threonine protein kinase [Desulfobacteraceae bacterium]MBT4365207.1 serine/threonine protein kinase [Desulfobacteraceae bacterium]MBT7085332.1 serine/threonine protein kinase [Desulfobacterales bacterium]MBT7698138.1 serine/threonine protein kinase [Desulfobacterales bacterium]
MDCFSELTPNLFLPALENALGTKLTALARTLPSYINRVYEIQAVDKKEYIAKFYRPGRWTYNALLDEHEFLLDCAEIDIPVVCPIKLDNGKTLGDLDNIAFSIFPKKAGRQFDIECDENWKRVGTLLGRLHNAGQKKLAPSRLQLSPATTTRDYVNQLIESSVTKRWQQPFNDICTLIIDTLSPYFENLETIRIHGDFHAGNILHRPDQGLMVIDFDDMMNGPPVQDFWLLLPDHYPASKYQLQMLLDGYRQFREVDSYAPLLIEGLRAMRIIYFTAWCSIQKSDYQFKTKFPDWGSDQFWGRETQDLRTQYANIMDLMSF